MCQGINAKTNAEQCLTCSDNLTFPTDIDVTDWECQKPGETEDDTEDDTGNTTPVGNPNIGPVIQYVQ